MSSIEALASLPSDERSRLADKFRLARHEDRHSTITDGLHGYQTERGLSEYYEAINNDLIEELIEHILTISSNPTLLDLGTGKGFAAKEIRDKFKEDRLRVVGTSMTFSKCLEENLGEENFHITSAEALQRVEKVDGILAVHSLSYVKPELFVPRANEVLNDGGVILANFSKPRSMWPGVNDEEKIAKELKRLYPNGFPMSEYNFDYYGFEESFRKLGYSTDIHVGSENLIFVALKPGKAIEMQVGDVIHLGNEKTNMSRLRTKFKPIAVKPINSSVIDKIDELRPKEQGSVKGVEIGESRFEIDGKYADREFTPISLDYNMEDILVVCVGKMHELNFSMEVILDTRDPENENEIMYLVERQDGSEHIADYFSYLLLPESINLFNKLISEGRFRDEAIIEVESSINKERVNGGIKELMKKSGRYYSEHRLARLLGD